MDTEPKKPKKKYLVVKRNDFNELSPEGMTLQQLRFIIIYLAMINPNDEATRLVRFSLNEFQAIMDMGRLNIKQLSDSVDSLLSKVTGITTKTGGVLRFQYFKKCLIDRDDCGEWYIEFDAHDEALPIFFNLKAKYFKYQLWNGLRLKSTNQLRFYEILKQYQWCGFRVMSVANLRKLLGINENEYSKFHDLKRYVIDVCQKALSEHTDISFTYEPYGKKGRGGKVSELRFTISANKKHQDPLTLDKFIEIETGSVVEVASEGYMNGFDKILADDTNTVYTADLTEAEHLLNFETFWEAYPEHKKSGILLAKNEWGKLPKSQVLFNEIMDGLKAAKKSNKWTTSGGIYVHEPCNWLRQERWRDNHEDVVKTSKNKPNKTKLQNYESRGWDYEKMAQLNEQYLNRKLAE